MNDKNYFGKVYKEACELTAYLCNMYNLNPKGTTVVNGIKVPVILCHADSYKLGLGSNHGDVLHWFKKYGKTMDDVRNDVSALMNKLTTSTNTDTSNSAPPSASVEIYRVRKSWKDAKSQVGAYKNLQNAKEICDKAGSGYYVFNSAGKAIYPESKSFEFVPYKVKITATTLNVRAGAGTSYKVNTTVKKGEVYTIIAESNGFGKLKSGAGWVSLSYCKKV